MEIHHQLKFRNLNLKAMCYYNRASKVKKSYKRGLDWNLQTNREENGVKIVSTTLFMNGLCYNEITKWDDCFNNYYYT